MINTVWENSVWQLDMQLMGKVVLSAAAFFLLGLAYRFYKFRTPEQSEKHGPGLTGAEGDVVDSPQRDYTNDESGNLRFRRVNSNLQNGLVTDPGRKRLADSSLGTHEVHVSAQEGFETADIICKDQNDDCREVTDVLHDNADPLQSHHRHHEEHATRQKDVCDGEENITRTERCREEPEGREMLEKSELVKGHSGPVPKNIKVLSSIDLTLSHQNETKQELHRFSSTSEVQMQESIIAEDGKALQTSLPRGLRGKIYDYHIESTSQSVTSKTGNDSLQSPLPTITSHIPASEEEAHLGLHDLVETTQEETKGNDPNQESILQKQDLTSESNTTGESEDIGGDTQKIRSTSNVSIAPQSPTKHDNLEAESCTPQPKTTDESGDIGGDTRHIRSTSNISITSHSPTKDGTLEAESCTLQSKITGERGDIGGDIQKIRSTSNITITSQSPTKDDNLEAEACPPQTKSTDESRDICGDTRNIRSTSNISITSHSPTKDDNLEAESGTTDESGDIAGDTSEIRSTSNISITSHSPTNNGTIEADACTPQPKLTYVHRDLPTPDENGAMPTSGNDYNNLKKDQAGPLQDEDFSNDTRIQVTGSNSSASANLTPSLSHKEDQNIAGALQTGPGTYHVSLTPESVFDIHIDLRNCYEVLSFAKKNNLENLKTAAYKIMSNDYLQVLQNSSVYGYLNATERDLILEGRMKGRRFVVVADIDTQAPSASQNQSSLSYYDNDNDVWHPLSKIPAEAVSRGSSMATMFNYLFVALGCDGLGRQMKPSRRVLCYNPITDSWKEISPLNEARPHCKLVALDGFLYAIGGECLHTVERYDPRQNRWTYTAPLPNDTFAVAHMATAYDDEIFVTGGTFRYMLLRYREREKIWKNSLVSGSKDRTTEMVASNNFLYRFDLNRSMGISVHRCNIRARIWYECATYPMPYPAPFQCAVIDNNIYCISRNFHMRFLAEDVSPRFMDTDLQAVPSPKGVLFPLVLVLPVEDKH